MPEFIVTAPDGKKYRVRGPDGATSEQALQQVQRQLGASAPAQQPAPAMGGAMAAAGGPAARQPSGDAARDIYGLPKSEGERQAERQGLGVAKPGPLKDITETAQIFAPAEAGAVGATALGRQVGRLATGTAKKSVEALRGGAVEQAGKAAGAEAAEAAPKAAEVQAATQRPPNAPPADAASQQSSRFALEQEYRRLGFGQEQARRMVAQSERRLQDAEQAVQVMEQQLLAKPGVTAQEFGRQLRTVTQNLADKYIKIRANQSGYTDAIRKAGDQLRVDTAGAQAAIDQQLKQSANPTLTKVLNGLKNLLKTDGHDAMSVQRVDSARKYLNDLRPGSMYEGDAINAETAQAVDKVKGALMDSARKAWPPYAEALKKWSILSRDLNVVTGKGALRPVIEKDPLTTEYKLQEAEVVGRVIRAGQRGNPVMARLLQESPDLKDSARLYFTRDLFGKERVPTAASMATWLKTNEGALKQLGLFDEFRDLRVARQTAQEAVNDAAGMVKKAKEAAKGAESAAAWRRYQMDLTTEPAEKVPGLTRKLIKDLHSGGRIGDQQYEAMMRQVQEVEKKVTARAERVARLKKIAKYAAIAAMGAAGYQTVRGVSGY